MSESRPKRDPTFGGVNVFGDALPTLDRAARLSAAEQADKAFADVEAELALEEKLKNEAEAAAKKAEADREAMEKYERELAEYNRKMEEYKVAKAKHDADVAARAAYEEEEKRREAERAVEAAAKKAEDDMRAEAEAKAADAAKAAEKAAADEVARADLDRAAKADAEAKAAADEDEAARRFEAEMALKAQLAADSDMSAEKIAFEEEAARLRSEAEAAMARQQAALDFNNSEERKRLQQEELDRVAKEAEDKAKRDSELASLNQMDDAAKQMRAEAERIAAERAKEQKAASNDFLRQMMEAEAAAAARKKAEAEEAAKTAAMQEQMRVAETARIEKEAIDKAAADLQAAEAAKAKAELDAAIAAEAASQAAAAAAQNAVIIEAEAASKKQRDELEALLGMNTRDASATTVSAAEPMPERRASALLGRASIVPAAAPAEAAPASRPVPIPESAPTPAPVTVEIKQRESEPEPIVAKPQPVAMYTGPVSGFPEPAHPFVQLCSYAFGFEDQALQSAVDENIQLKNELARLLKLEAAVAGGQSIPDMKAAASGTADQDACRAVFAEFDLDRSGYMDTNEVSLLAAQLGQPLDETELAVAVRSIDLNGDGKITFDEFWAWWSAQTAGTSHSLVSSEKGALKLASLKAKLISRQATKVANTMVAASDSKSGAATSAGADFISKLASAMNQTAPSSRADPLLKLSLEVGTAPSYSRPAALTLTARMAADLPSDVLALQFPSGSKAKPNSFTTFSVKQSRRAGSAQDTQDAVSDLYTSLCTPSSASAKAGGAAPAPPADAAWHVATGSGGSTRVTVARFDEANSVKFGDANSDSSLAHSTGVWNAKWERTYGLADCLDAKRGLTVGDVTGNFRASLEVAADALRFYIALFAASGVTPTDALTNVLATRQARAQDILEYLRWGCSISVNVRVGDYSEEARELISKYQARNVLDGVDIDLYRLFTQPVTDKLSQIVYGWSESVRNQSRRELADDLTRVRAVLKMAERDIDECTEITHWAGRTGLGITLAIEPGSTSGSRLSEWNQALGFAVQAAQRPPSAPASWVQTISRARYPLSNSKDDDDVRAKLNGGYVPSSIIGFLKPTPVGVSVLGFQIMYKQPGTSGSGGAHVGRIQHGQVDITAKDIKTVTLNLNVSNDVRETITKIGLTLASPKNKYLSVSFHTSAGQVFTLGGSAGPYHYVLGNGVNTAFVNLTGDFGGHHGALRNLAYWCVGL